MGDLKKFRVILIALGLICINLVQAQFSGGAHFGLNAASFRGSSAKNKSMLLGYNLGGFANLSGESFLKGDIAKIMSLQADLNIETKGGVMDYPAIESSSDSFIYVTQSQKLNLTYVSIPIMAKFSFGDEKLIYYAEAGVYGSGLFGVAVDGEREYDHDFDKDSPNRNYRDDFDGFDVGMIIGGGASLPFGGRKSPWRAFSELRYTMGFASIGEKRKNTPDYFTEFLSDLKTSAVSLSFGFAYKFL